MNKLMLQVSVLGCALALGGCCGKDKTDEKPSTGTTTGSSTGEVGVAECDEFLKKFDECISRQPAAAKPTLQSARKSFADTWTKLAGSSLMKAQLPKMCKEQLDKLKAGQICK